MKRLLWPDSLRGRLIILALFCLVLFQAVNTATLFFVQHQQREHRLTLLASQAAEWYTIRVEDGMVSFAFPFPGSPRSAKPHKCGDKCKCKEA